MIYIKQDDYDNFKCIAGDCPSSCCIGWQIVIDDESLENYSNITGDFRERIDSGVDFEEGVFYQNNRRCSMLNDCGLCDLYTACGEEALCYTCTMYPRHEEEYENVREWSLSLSCPEAARIAVHRTEPMLFVTEEDDKEDDFEEFDYLLYDKLDAARESIYRVAQNRNLPILDRLKSILAFAKELQGCIDDDELFTMDDIIDEFDASAVYEFEIKPNSIKALEQLERLSDNWDELLADAKEVDFSAITEAEEIAAEQILVSLIFTYFCGAVYDDAIFSKAALCVYSVYWIFMIYKGKSEAEDLDLLTEVLYRYAKEVEHSDLNLNTLEDYFMEI